MSPPLLLARARKEARAEGVADGEEEAAEVEAAAEEDSRRRCCETSRSRSRFFSMSKKVSSTVFFFSKVGEKKQRKTFFKGDDFGLYLLESVGFAPVRRLRGFLEGSATERRRTATVTASSS